MVLCFVEEAAAQVTLTQLARKRKPTAEPEPDPELDPEPEPESKSESESEPEQEPEWVPEPEPESKSESEPELLRTYMAGGFVGSLVGRRAPSFEHPLLGPQAAPRHGGIALELSRTTPNGFAPPCPPLLCLAL